MPDAFAAKVAEITDRAATDAARRRLWLSHHWPDGYDRCTTIGGRHVCRRCLALYPLSIAVALLARNGAGLWPARFDPALIWLLSIPGTIEFVAEQLGVLRYSARRQTVVTAVVALAFGRGLSYELASRWSWYFWGPLIVFGTLWFLSAMIGRRWRGGRPHLEIGAQ